MMIGPEGIDDSPFINPSEENPLPDDTEKTVPSDEELRRMDPDELAKEIETQEE